MTREQYLDMMEQMGLPPEEEDIPPDPSTFTFDSQNALRLFKVLPDKIEGMNGVWLGKDFSGLMDIMELYEMPNKREVFELLIEIVDEASRLYEERRKTRQSLSKG